jgi:hypothetical protein
MKAPDRSPAEEPQEVRRLPPPVGSRWQLGLSFALLVGWLIFLAITAFE